MQDHGQLWTPVLLADDIVVEVRLPAGTPDGALALELTSINYGYRGFGETRGGGGYASCTSQTSDWYGRFSVSWGGGGMATWLDPGATGAMTADTITSAGTVHGFSERFHASRYGTVT